jgi:hypothetical protein
MLIIFTYPRGLLKLVRWGLIGNVSLSLSHADGAIGFFFLFLKLFRLFFRVAVVKDRSLSGRPATADGITTTAIATATPTRFGR